LLAGLVIIAFRLLIDIPLSWLLPEHTEDFEGLAHRLRLMLQKHPVWVLIDDPLVLISPADVQKHLEQAGTQEKINLLEIPARRLDMIEVSIQANLFQAWELLNQRQVGAVYVRNRRGEIAGIISREQLENFYRV
jgi:CIC family chloride channel protein